MPVRQNAAKLAVRRSMALQSELARSATDEKSEAPDEEKSSLSPYEAVLQGAWYGGLLGLFVGIGTALLLEDRRRTSLWEPIALIASFAVVGASLGAFASSSARIGMLWEHLCRYEEKRQSYENPFEAFAIAPQRQDGLQSAGQRRSQESDPETRG